MRDIENTTDVKVFVDEFYAKVQQDDLLSAVFALRIKTDDWERHLNRMYAFWNTVLFFEKDYKGNPFSKHVNLPIEQKHFFRWTHLFKATIDEHFAGERAEETKRRADKMAGLFVSKLNHLRNNRPYKSIM